MNLLKPVIGLAIFTGIVAGGAAIGAVMSLGAAGVGTLLAGTMTAALATKVAIVGGSLGAAGAFGGMALFGILDGMGSTTGEASPWRAYRGVGLSAAAIAGTLGAIASFTMGCMSGPDVKTSLNNLDAANDFNRVALVQPVQAVSVSVKQAPVLKI